MMICTEQTLCLMTCNWIETLRFNTCETMSTISICIGLNINCACI